MPKLHHRLKEPGVNEVNRSVTNLVESAIKHALIDHRGDMTIAELALIAQMYLTKALESLDDRKAAKAIVADVLAGVEKKEKLH